MSGIKSPVRFGLTLLLLAAAGRADEFDSDGVGIHYIVRGKGEPVVLIHGLYSSAKVNWELPGTVDLLAKDYTVVALDNRGHGQSGKPQTEDQYGVKMVGDVLHLMNHLRIEKAHIVGYSMGEMITMKFLTMHPQRTRSAILGGMGWLREGGVLQRFWERMPDRDSEKVPQACVHGLSKLAVTEKEVRAIKSPVAVIVGDRDPVKRMYVEPLRAIRTDWPVTLIKDAGHLNCIVKPEFRTHLKAFLDKNSTSKQK